MKFVFAKSDILRYGEQSENSPNEKGCELTFSIYVTGWRGCLVFGGTCHLMGLVVGGWSIDVNFDGSTRILPPRHAGTIYKYHRLITVQPRHYVVAVTPLRLAFRWRIALFHKASSS